MSIRALPSLSLSLSLSLIFYSLNMMRIDVVDCVTCGSKRWCICRPPAALCPEVPGEDDDDDKRGIDR